MLTMITGIFLIFVVMPAIGFCKAALRGHAPSSWRDCGAKAD